MLLKEKFSKLQGILREMESALIAYSGGVDSTFLIKVAKDVLGEKALAVIATSATFPRAEFKEAKRQAQDIGMPYLVIKTEELLDPSFYNNPPERCYYCKRGLFDKLQEIAGEKGFKFILDGTNQDDQNDFRPGRKAGQEFKVRSPLFEAGLSKEDIRILSRELGLSTWDKPSQACLSSRFPYGQIITEEKLRIVEEGEEFIRSLGFRQVRLRHHGKLARLEVDKEDLPKFFDNGIGEKIKNKLIELGYLYITVDLEGYRSGSLNNV